jgi:transposase
MQITTIGLDIAKNVFQVHGVNRQGQAVLRRKVRRDQLLPLFRRLEPCLIGIEACVIFPRLRGHRVSSFSARPVRV